MSRNFDIAICSVYTILRFQSFVNCEIIVKLLTNGIEKGLREHKNRLGEDNRHYTGVVNAQGHEGTLTTVNLTTYNALCMLHRNATCTLRNGYGPCGDLEEGHQQRNQMEVGVLSYPTDGCEHLS